MNDELIFANEDTKTLSDDAYDILIVDDDESIHAVTILALKHKIFDSKRLNIISAMSAKEAKEILDKDNDIALALIDVMMETAEAGLDLVNYIRNDLKNTNIRLVLRTGQASQVPEEKIIDHYDINDYKEKTELTSEKLYTIVRTSIKQYELIKGLESKIDEITNELNDKNELLLKESRMFAMSNILSMVAHQWRQPLASIGMYNNNLLLNIDLDNVDINMFKENLEHSNILIRELSDIIDDFSSFFKSDISTTSVNISELIDKSCELIDSRIKDNSIKIIKKTINDINFKTDKDSLIKIILSLLQNSIDSYIKNDIEYRPINISTKENKTRIEIIIQDDAGGISQDIIENIFDPYFSTKDDKNNTGLSLYISKVILEMYLNSKLSVEVQGLSTTFTISINKTLVSIK